MVHPIEEFLQIEIDDPAIPVRDMLLRPGHRLMRGSTGTKAIARVRERRVPNRLKHLQHRLLDEAVENRRYAESANTPADLRDLDTQHRLRPVSAVEQLAPDRGPVVLEVEWQGVDGHPVDARRTPVAPDLRQRPTQIVTLDNRLHERSQDRRAFEPRGRRIGFGPFGGSASGFTRHPFPKGQLQLVLLPPGRHEIPRPTCRFQRSGLR